MGLLILRLAIVCSTGGLIVGYSGSADWPAICLGYVVGILAGLYLGAERVGKG